MRSVRACTIGVAALVCGGCALHNAQNVLDASGPQAAGEAGLYWLMLPIAVTVWLLVVIVLLWGAARKKIDGRIEGEGPTERIEADEGTKRGLTRTVIGALAVTVVTLFIVLVADFRVGQALTVPPKAKVVPIQVIGHQFWWELWYPDSVPHNTVITANEMHIPVGTPVVMELQSRDVIHSIWVPNLSGKKDLIPGYTRTLWFRADTPGVYRGQCAEYCGYQHANMGLLVVAEPQAKYDAWKKAQQSDAAIPSDTLAQRGKTVFEGSTCVMCHNISGTIAGATLGPDLTHIASRGMIASNTLPNTPANLIAWISDPQGIKPGTLMPATKLEPHDLVALVAYLRQLK